MDSIAASCTGCGTVALRLFCEKYGFKGLAKSLEAQVSRWREGLLWGSTQIPSGLSPSKPSDKRRESGEVFGAKPGLFDAPETTTPVPRTSNLAYDTILTWEQFDTWLAKLETAELTALDTETTSLDEMRAEIVGISFSVTPGEAAYIPVTHRYYDAPVTPPRRAAPSQVTPPRGTATHTKW